MSIQSKSPVKNPLQYAVANYRAGAGVEKNDYQAAKAYIATLATVKNNFHRSSELFFNFKDVIFETVTQADRDAFDAHFDEVFNDYIAGNAKDDAETLIAAYEEQENAK